MFATIGKSGGCAYSQAEGLSRLISLSLRSGINANSIIKQLRGIRCTSPIWEDGEMILSCADGIGRVLDIFMQNRKDKSDVKQVNVNFGVTANRTSHKAITGETCPECSSSLEMAEGCMTCRSCGYSKCS